jgi:hypothetical protein
MTNYGYSLPSCFEILVNRIGLISQSKNKITWTNPREVDTIRISITYACRVSVNQRSSVWMTPALPGTARQGKCAAGASICRTRQRWG